MLKRREGYKYYTFFCMLQITALIATVLTIHKIWQIRLWNDFIILFPVSTLIFPITYFFCDVVTEVYGYALSRQLIWTSMICQYLFAITVYLLIKLPSPPQFDNVAHYDYVLGGVLALTIANNVGVVVGAFINSYIISITKIRLKGKRFWLRSIISTAAGELAVTVIVAAIAFFKTTDVMQLLTIITVCYLFKFIYGVLAVIPATYLVNYLKRTEDIDVLDYDTNFNPFKLSIMEKPQGIVGSSINDSKINGSNTKQDVWCNLITKVRSGAYSEAT